MLDINAKYMENWNAIYDTFALLKKTAHTVALNGGNAIAKREDLQGIRDTVYQMKDAFEEMVAWDDDGLFNDIVRLSGNAYGYCDALVEICLVRGFKD